MCGDAKVVFEAENKRMSPQQREVILDLDTEFRYALHVIEMEPNEANLRKAEVILGK